MAILNDRNLKTEFKLLKKYKGKIVNDKKFKD